ncbi:MAG: 50S ribosomal protein L35 [Bacilli bacterium]|jgi:large subunit ribosomal protein L35|nr:50S ribosomal protein L35 [Bacilli bacterium]
MPKMKSKRGAVKRFKITATGKIKKWNQNTSHLSHNKQHKNIVHNRKARYLNNVQTIKMKGLISR